MAQLEELRVKFQDDVSAGANAAAAALAKVGQGAEGATEAMRQTDEVVKRVGTSAEQLARKYIEAERATALREQSERRHARALGDVAAAEQAGSVTAERAAQLRTEIARRAELDAARIVAAAERRQQAEARALGGGVSLNGTTSVAAAEAQLTRLSSANDNATRSSGRFSSAMGQAGFQVQDFATQVSMGQNAVTAFGVQFAQFAGAFGPAGALAGAAVTVGVLASQFVDLGPKIDTVAEAERNLQSAISASNELYESAIDRANRLARARVTAAAVGIEERITVERAALRALNTNNADVEDRRAFARDRVGGNSTDNNPVIRAERERVAREAEAISTRIAALDLELSRLRSMTANGDQYGPPGEEFFRDRNRQEEEARRQAETAAQRRTREEEQIAARQAQRVQQASQQETTRQEREAREAIERQQREEQRALDERQRQNERTTDDIVRYGADRFADLFDRNGQGFKGLMRTFETTARQTFARIAAEAIIRPIIAPIVSELGLGSLTGAGGAAGGGLGSLGGLSSLSSFLPSGGLGGITSAINGFGVSSGMFGNGVTFAANSGAASYGGFGAAGEGAVSGLLGPGTLMQGLGSAAGGFAIGSTVGGMVAGRSQARQTNAQIGAGIGTAAGFFLPGGPLVWGAIGGAAGGLLGPGEKTNAFGFNLRASGGRFGADGMQTTGNGGGGDQAIAAARQQAEQINAILAAGGLSVADAYRVINGQTNSEDQSANVADAFRVFRFSGSGNVGRAVNDRAFASPDELAATVDWVQNTYEALAGIAKPTDQWAQQIKALNDNFGQAITKAREYGLATEGLVANQAKAVAQINAQRESTILSGLLQQSRVLSGFLNSRATATGSAQSQFSAAQLQYEAALSSARSGTAETANLSGLVTSANTLLNANASFYGSGAQAAAIESMVRSQITALGGQLDLPGFTTDITGAIYRASDRQADAAAAQQVVLESLREEVRGLRLVIERQQVA